MKHSRQTFYIYNPATDNFERVYPTLKSKVLKLGRFLLMSAIFGAIFFCIAYYGFIDNSEEELRNENILLRSQYNVLESRVDASLKVMERIKERDDNFYRVMMQMDPMSISRRFAGFDYEKNYRGLKKMSDKALVGQLTQMVDMLDHELYSQIQSFDQLREAAASRQTQVDHIPGSLPISMANSTLAGGYGIRRDPLSGQRKFHPGLDFSAPEGTPVYATADGVVEVSERRGVYGNLVEIDHGYNYMTRFAHLSEMEVSKGDKVRRGDLLGYVGSTGTSTGSHLHYEVRLKDQPQNPVNYFFLDLTPPQYSEMSRQAEDAANVMD